MAVIKYLGGGASAPPGAPPGQSVRRGPTLRPAAAERPPCHDQASRRVPIGLHTDVVVAGSKAACTLGPKRRSKCRQGACAALFARTGRDPLDGGRPACPYPMSASVAFFETKSVHSSGFTTTTSVRSPIGLPRQALNCGRGVIRHGKDAPGNGDGRRAQKAPQKIFDEAFPKGIAIVSVRMGDDSWPATAAGPRAAAMPRRAPGQAETRRAGGRAAGRKKPVALWQGQESGFLVPRTPEASAGCRPATCLPAPHAIGLASRAAARHSLHCCAVSRGAGKRRAPRPAGQAAPASPAAPCSCRPSHQARGATPLHARDRSAGVGRRSALWAARGGNMCRMLHGQQARACAARR